MAKYTQEDIDKIEDSLKEKYGYDDMSDDKKKAFDDTFSAEVDSYRERGLIEDKKTDANDTSDGTDPTDKPDDDDGDDAMENGMERGRGPGQGGKEKDEGKDDDEALVKEKENQQMRAQIEHNEAAYENENPEEEDGLDEDDDRGDYAR